MEEGGSRGKRIRFEDEIAATDGVCEVGAKAEAVAAALDGETAKRNNT